MKKIYTIVSMFLISMLPMTAYADCMFTDSILPGQYRERNAHHVEATIPVGTIVDTEALLITDFASTDSSVVLPYNSGNKQIKMYALAVGKAIVSYTQAGIDGSDLCYSNHSVNYTVVKGTPQGGFEVGGSGVATEYDYDMGDNLPYISAMFYTPTALIQGGVPMTLRKKVDASQISYQTTDASVAYMNTSTGRLVIVGGGTATITASWPGNDNWNEVVATLKVNVEADPLRLKVAGVKVDKTNKNDILGDGKAVYDSETQTLTLHNVNWDFSDHSIDTKYGAIEFWGAGEFKVLLDGKNVFSNTSIGINTKVHNTVKNQGEIDLLIEGKNNGSLQMTVYETQIICDEWVFIDTAEICISTEARYREAFEASALVVSDKSRVVISAYGENGKAADVRTLHIDEHMYLQDVHFLSAEVSPSKYGFYTEAGEIATVVSILPYSVRTVGSIETVPSATEETEVALAPAAEPAPGEEPQEEVAAISLGENDQYNETKKQLEIVTTLTDEEVNEALKTFGPAAEALKYMLPGTISFFIPAGNGEIQLQCETANGKQIQLKIGDLLPQSIIQAAMDWVKVKYDVKEDTYVILYIGDQKASEMPAYRRMVAEEAPAVSAAVKALKIKPADVPAGIENIINDQAPITNKVLRDGQLLILRDGKTYTVTGVELR